MALTFEVSSQAVAAEVLHEIMAVRPHSVPYLPTAYGEKVGC